MDSASPYALASTKPLLTFRNIVTRKHVLYVFFVLQVISLPKFLIAFILSGHRKNGNEPTGKIWPIQRNI